MIIQRAVKPWYTELGDGTKAITNSQLATKAQGFSISLGLSSLLFASSN